MKRIAPFAAVLLALFMFGCSKNDEPSVARHDAGTPQPTATNAPVEAFVPVPGVTFEVSPMQFRKCEADKGRIVADIKWDVAAAGVQYVNVLVSNGGSEPKLFMTGKVSGEHKSGNWVIDGTEFTLQNASNKKLLAVVKIKGVDC